MSQQHLMAGLLEDPDERVRLGSRDVQVLPLTTDTAGVVPATQPERA